MQSLSIKRAKLPHNNYFGLINYGVLLGIIALSGVILGAIITRSKLFSTDNYISVLLQAFINSHKSGGFIQILSFSFLSGISLILLVQLSAFCCIGFAIIPLIPLLKGMFVGCLSSYLFMQMGVKGAFVNILLFWVPQAVQSIIIIYLSAVALDTSLALFHNTFLGQKQGISTKYKRCVKSFVFSGIMLLFTAIIESSLAALFAFAL